MISVIATAMLYKLRRGRSLSSLAIWPSLSISVLWGVIIPWLPWPERLDRTGLTLMTLLLVGARLAFISVLSCVLLRAFGLGLALFALLLILGVVTTVVILLTLFLLAVGYRFLGLVVGRVGGA